MGERGRETRRKEREEMEESAGRGNGCFENTRKPLKVRVSKTVGVITGDVWSSREKAVNTVCKCDNS